MTEAKRAIRAAIKSGSDSAMAIAKQNNPKLWKKILEANGDHRKIDKLLNVNSLLDALLWIPKRISSLGGTKIAGEGTAAAKAESAGIKGFIRTALFPVVIVKKIVFGGLGFALKKLGLSSYLDLLKLGLKKIIGFIPSKTIGIIKRTLGFADDKMFNRWFGDLLQRSLADTMSKMSSKYDDAPWNDMYAYAMAKGDIDAAVRVAGKKRTFMDIGRVMANTINEAFRHIADNFRSVDRINMNANQLEEVLSLPKALDGAVGLGDIFRTIVDNIFTSRFPKLISAMPGLVKRAGKETGKMTLNVLQVAYKYNPFNLLMGKVNKLSSIIKSRVWDNMRAGDTPDKAVVNVISESGIDEISEGRKIEFVDNYIKRENPNFYGCRVTANAIGLTGDGIVPCADYPTRFNEIYSLFFRPGYNQNRRLIDTIQKHIVDLGFEEAVFKKDSKGVIKSLNLDIDIINEDWLDERYLKKGSDLWNLIKKGDINKARIRIMELYRDDFMMDAKRLLPASSIDEITKDFKGAIEAMEDSEVTDRFVYKTSFLVEAETLMLANQKKISQLITRRTDSSLDPGLIKSGSDFEKMLEWKMTDFEEFVRERSTFGGRRGFDSTIRISNTNLYKMSKEELNAKGIPEWDVTFSEAKARSSPVSPFDANDNFKGKSVKGRNYPLQIGEEISTKIGSDFKPIVVDMIANPVYSDSDIISFIKYIDEMYRLSIHVDKINPSRADIQRLKHINGNGRSRNPYLIINRATADPDSEILAVIEADYSKIENIKDYNNWKKQNPKSEIYPNVWGSNGALDKAKLNSYDGSASSIGRPHATTGNFMGYDPSVVLGDGTQLKMQVYDFNFQAPKFSDGRKLQSIDAQGKITKINPGDEMRFQVIEVDARTMKLESDADITSNNADVASALVDDGTYYKNDIDDSMNVVSRINQLGPGSKSGGTIDLMGSQGVIKTTEITLEDGSTVNVFYVNLETQLDNGDWIQQRVILQRDDGLPVSIMEDAQVQLQQMLGGVYTQYGADKNVHLVLTESNGLDEFLSLSTREGEMAAYSDGRTSRTYTSEQIYNSYQERSPKESMSLLGSDPSTETEFLRRFEALKAYDQFVFYTRKVEAGIDTGKIWLPEYNRASRRNFDYQKLADEYEDSIDKDLLYWIQGLEAEYDAGSTVNNFLAYKYITKIKNTLHLELSKAFKKARTDEAGDAIIDQVENAFDIFNKARVSLEDIRTTYPTGIRGPYRATNFDKFAERFDFNIERDSRGGTSLLPEGSVYGESEAAMANRASTWIPMHWLTAYGTQFDKTNRPDIWVSGWKPGDIFYENRPRNLNDVGLNQDSSPLGLWREATVEDIQEDIFGPIEDWFVEIAEVDPITMIYETTRNDILKKLDLLEGLMMNYLEYSVIKVKFNDSYTPKELVYKFIFDKIDFDGDVPINLMVSLDFRQVFFDGDGDGIYEGSLILIDDRLNSAIFLSDEVMDGERSALLNQLEGSLPRLDFRYDNAYTQFLSLLMLREFLTKSVYEIDGRPAWYWALLLESMSGSQLDAIYYKSLGYSFQELIRSNNIPYLVDGSYMENGFLAANVLISGLVTVFGDEWEAFVSQDAMGPPINDQDSGGIRVIAELLKMTNVMLDPRDYNFDMISSDFVNFIDDFVFEGQNDNLNNLFDDSVDQSANLVFYDDKDVDSYNALGPIFSNSFEFVLATANINGEYSNLKDPISQSLAPQFAPSNIRSFPIYLTLYETRQYYMSFVTFLFRIYRSDKLGDRLFFDSITAYFEDRERFLMPFGNGFISDDYATYETFSSLESIGLISNTDTYFYPKDG